MAQAAEAFSFLADLIGVASGLASFIQLGAGGAANPPTQASYNQLSIAVGMTSDTDPYLSMALFRQDGALIADANSVGIGNGDTTTVSMNNCGNGAIIDNSGSCTGNVGQQAYNVTIYPDNFFYDDDGPPGAYDACIVGVTLTQAGSPGYVYGWSGDTWNFCTYPAYPGGVNFGSNASNPHQPYCAQLLNSNEANTKARGTQSLNLNMTYFVAPPDGSNPPPASSLCALSAMIANNVVNGTVVNAPPPTQRPNRKRAEPTPGLLDARSRSTSDQLDDNHSVRILAERAASGGPFQNRNETRMVMSTLGGPNNSAKNLCNMANGWGPDFINIKEGFYCDMSTRTLNTLCPAPTAMQCMDNCWRWDGNLTMGYYKGGMLQTTKKTYTKMLRHPHPLTSTDATLPGACGTF